MPVALLSLLEWCVLNNSGLLSEFSWRSWNKATIVDSVKGFSLPSSRMWNFVNLATLPTLPAVSTGMSSLLPKGKHPPFWFMGPKSDHLPPLDPLSCSTALFQPMTWWMLTDDAPRSYMENTQHLLQLLSLTTIFEFDGLSNYIPPLSCHRGSGGLQIKLLML